MRFLIILLLSGIYGFGQSSASVSISLPQISLLDIEPNSSAVNLALTTATEAGNAPGLGNSNNSKWINFTSAVSSGGTRKITAQLNSPSLSGLNINLAVSGVAGSGAGTRGLPVSPIILSTTPQTIVNGIGGAYTGNGTGNGYNLTYSLSIANFSQLKANTQALTVIYTLIDN